MKAFRTIKALILIALALASCAHCKHCHGACNGSSWHPPQPASLEVFQDGYPVADQASERIPPACVQGVVNARFQWMPGPLVVLEIAEHYWTKYRVGNWLQNRALPFLEKYAPIVAQWEGNISKARNAVIIATPLILKIIHKL